MTILTIAQLELVAAIRLKWLRLLTLAFALLAGAAAYASGAADELAGADGFARTTMTLVPVVLILAPLAALVLGLSGQAADPDGQGFLFVQPIGRSTVLAGRWLGESAALAAAVAGGLGAGAVVIAAGSGAAGIAGYALFVAAASRSRSCSCRSPRRLRQRPSAGRRRSASASSSGSSSCCSTTARSCRLPAGSPDGPAAGCCSRRCSATRRIWCGS